MCNHKRWKYAILVGAFVVNFLNTGTAKSFGVLIPELARDFGTGLSILGFGIGMCHGVAVGLAFIGRPLLQVTSYRVLTMVGGLIASLGFVSCSLSSTVIQFTIGIACGGLGYSLGIISNVVIVRDYFGEDFSIAASFTFTGGAVGMMVIPVLTEKLDAIYGWRGSLLLVAALNLHTVTAGALYRPHEKSVALKRNLMNPRTDNAETSSSEDVTSGSRPNVKNERSLREKCKPNTNKNDPIEDSYTSDDDDDDDEQDTHKKIRRTISVHEWCVPGQSVDKLRRPESFADFADSSSDEAVSQSDRKHLLDKPDFMIDKHSKHSDEERKPAIPLRKSRKVFNSTSSPYQVMGLCRNIVDLFDLRLVYDVPVIMLLMVTALLSGATITGWIAFLVPNGQWKGYSKDHAVLLATIGGFGNIVGRFFVGYIIEGRFKLSARLVFLFSNLLSGLAFCLNPLATEYWVLSILSAINGLTAGAIVVLVCLTIEEVVEESRFASGVALTYIFMGIGEVFGGLFGGWLYDMTLSYDVPFVSLGLLNIITAILTAFALSKCSAHAQ